MLLAPLQVGDLAYLLRAGDLMWAERAVLRVDRFTYTIPGAAWLNQQWGAQLLFAGWFAAFGWKGLLILQALIVAASFGTTFRGARRRGVADMVAAGTTLGCFAVAASLPGALALRPQALALPLFVASAWIIRERRASPRWLVALPVIGIAWANVHGSFVLLTVLLTIALIADVADRARTLRWTALLVAASLLTPMVSPWGPSIYTYVWRLSTNPMIREVIAEWRPLLTREPAGALFVLACLVGAVALWRKRSRRPTIDEWLTLVVFTGLALFSARNVLWWSVAVPAAFCAPLAGWRPGGTWHRGVTRAVIAALVALILLAGLRVVRTDPAALRSEAPAGITAWLASQPADRRIFAEWWGGWFEYALPDRPMFVDARVELFPQATWDEYLDVVDVDPTWEATLDDWQIDTVVVAAGHHPELVAALEADPGWSRAYVDGDGTVFVRTCSSPADCPTPST